MRWIKKRRQAGIVEEHGNMKALSTTLAPMGGKHSILHGCNIPTQNLQFRAANPCIQEQLLLPMKQPQAFKNIPYSLYKCLPLQHSPHSGTSCAKTPGHRFLSR